MNFKRKRSLNKTGCKLYGTIDNIEIPDSAIIGHYCLISAHDDSHIILKENVSISSGVKLITQGLDLESRDIPRKHKSYGDIIIEENVWIGTDAMIKGGVTIGKNSVIGAKSYVTKDVPPNSLAFGIPARVVKELPQPNEIDKDKD